MAVKTMTLRNATDTFVNEKEPAKTASGTKFLWVKSGGADTKYAYLYFPISLPDDAVVTKATLTLTLENPASGSRTFTAARVTEKWAAANTKWNNRPAATAGVDVTKTGTGGGNVQEWSFNVTSHVQAFLGNTKNYGWRITSNETENRKFYSAQGDLVGRRPELVIEYNLPPNKPTNLTPAGGLAVGAPKPKLTFTFTDPNGNSSQKGFEVQIANNAAMTGAATYAVTSGSSVLDLATTAYAGLAEGATAYWRVRAQDQSNLWSPWSNIASFTYVPKPTVTITAPASGGEFNESTPTVTWTLSAGIQERFRVVVKQGTTTLHDSGVVASALTEYRIPAGVITRDDVTYTFTVQAWDTVDRAETNGDPSYATATVNSTFQYTDAVAPVANFNAMALSPKPGVRITWTSTTADEFEVKRDGVVIATDIADEFRVSGTSFEYYDYAAPVYKTVTYEVVAKVMGAGSSNNPYEAVNSGPVGIWLIDKSTKTEVHILGDDEGTWNMGEISGVFAPVSRGGDFVAPTIVTQALRGYEGSLSGLLTESHLSNKTLDQMVADVWKLKQQAGKTYTLILSDMVMQVVIANVTVTPTPNRDLSKKISFDFWQVDKPKDFFN